MSADLVIALLKILRSSRTAGLEKLRCSARRLCERQVWAGNDRWPASVQIDAAEARRMDMRLHKQCSGRAGQSAEQMSLPRDARLTRKNAPENGTVEQTDHQCRAQRDQ